jgi:chemotaxis protein methyltransferase CheR
VDDVLQWVGRYLGFRTSGARGSFLTARIKQFLAENGVHPSDLLANLEHDGVMRRRLTELVTITETSFFRNPPQMEMFAAEILPKVMETRRRSGTFRFRLWSAGCSIGAEPYSLAMLLLEGVALPEAWDLEILATDINTKAIGRVDEGVFTSRELEGVNKNRRGRFFEALGSDRWRVIPEVRRLVKTATHNLAGPPPPGPFDIIFCRNLLIYSREETVRTILDHFAQCLSNDGALFLGHSELPALHSTRWKSLSTQNAVCYRVANTTERS